jgi:predicted aldo/keto reductase-like oxidoreductase
VEYRRLGRTGVTISSLCLGAMMRGDRGNMDHDDCISAGESEVIVGKALAGAAARM